jgi:multidrug efflux pump subunit AcrA (membrane-fusion protein)
VQGFLESIDYVDGATVKSGTQLFGIQRNIYEAQLAQASATLQADRATQANADTNYHRQLYLAKDDFASQATLDNAKTQFDTAVAATLGAEAALEQAKINLGYTKVVAHSMAR